MADGSGNTGIAGTLTTTGATVLNGGLAMDTDKFTVADGSGNTGIAGTLDVTGATTVTGATVLNGGLSVTGVGLFSVGVTVSASSVTATASGSGSGLISYGVSFVSVTSSDSDYLITLPPSQSSTSACSVGHTMKLFGSAGYKLQTSSPASISIQGTSGASCASTVASNVLLECTCTTGTSYVCISISGTGDVTALPAPSCSRRRSLLTELVF